MSGKSQTKGGTEHNSLSKFYLLAYNFVQFFGWSYLLSQMVMHFLHGGTQSTLWNTVKWTLIIFQNAAFLEILHAALGIVRSNVAVTTMQVFSRLMVVDGILLATPTAPASIGLPIVIMAWGVTECIRSLLYALTLLKCVPYFLTWCRYSFFFVLYPLGVTGELLCMYAAQMFVQKSKQWSVEMPNFLNFTFSYLYFIWAIMLLYIPGFPPLYMHMISQRRKVIGGDSLKKKS